MRISTMSFYHKIRFMYHKERDHEPRDLVNCLIQKGTQLPCVATLL